MRNQSWTGSPTECGADGCCSVPAPVVLCVPVLDPPLAVQAEHDLRSRLAGAGTDDQRVGSAFAPAQVGIEQDGVRRPGRVMRDRVMRDQVLRDIASGHRASGPATPERWRSERSRAPARQAVPQRRSRHGKWRVGRPVRSAPASRTRSEGSRWSARRGRPSAGRRRLAASGRFARVEPRATDDDNRHPSARRDRIRQKAALSALMLVLDHPFAPA